jgi:hypothetical protein
MEKCVKRRWFLKIMAMTVAGSCAAPHVLAETLKNTSFSASGGIDNHIRDYLHKMHNFDYPHIDDRKIGKAKYDIFKSVVQRLSNLQETAGHGNFQIMSFDEGLEMAGNYSSVGKFTPSELEFMEMIFYQDASEYGFFGKKPLLKITDRINRAEVIKVPYHGNYLYKGVPYGTYKKIRKQLGEKVVLTSGVRGVMKQFLLFLNKAYKSGGNLSLASRSLAPPGYSFHGNGDFDVGQAGFGELNFTERFISTDVYKRLSDMGYLKLRYEQDNHVGVRFEPWHIKVL